MSKLIAEKDFETLKAVFCILPMPDMNSKYSVLRPIIQYANDKGLGSYAMESYDPSQPETQELQALHILKIITESWDGDGYTIKVENKKLLAELAMKVVRRMELLSKSVLENV